ncbi:MAG: hypothetical protein GX774_22150 [Armatimonadetes bacterium]|nr:hypothetical protein [Armatimonadota bacterium]
MSQTRRRTPARPDAGEAGRLPLSGAWCCEAPAVRQLPRRQRGLRAAVWRLLLATLAVLGAVLPASAATPGADLLKQAFRNPRRVAHHGTLEVRVFTAPRSAATVRVVCDGKGRERREHLSGPTRGLTVLTDGRAIWQRLAADAPWTRAPGSLPDEAAWERLRSNYQFVTKGQKRVAGRLAWVIALSPRHAGNPRQTLWVDAANALILRSECYTHAGKLAMTTAYTKVTLGAPATGALRLPAAASSSAAAEEWVAWDSRAELQRQLGTPVPLPTRLPAGYHPVGYHLRPCRQGGQLPVVRYSDGLNPLTLFVTRGQGMGRGGGRGWGMGRGKGGGGLGWGWGRGKGGPGACVVQQVDGQQVARTTYDNLTYVLIGNHSPQGLEAALKSIR